MYRPKGEAIHHRKFTKKCCVRILPAHLHLFTVMALLVSLSSRWLHLTTALLPGQPTTGHLQMGFCLRMASMLCLSYMWPQRMFFTGFNISFLLKEHTVFISTWVIYSSSSPDSTQLLPTISITALSTSHAPPPPPCSPSCLSPAACTPPPHQMYSSMAFFSLSAATYISSSFSCCLTQLATNMVMATPASTCLVKDNHYHHLPCL